MAEETPEKLKTLIVDDEPLAVERMQVILIEEDDVDRNLDEIWDGCTLLDMLWEGIMLRDGFFIAIYLANNEYGLTSS